MSGLACIKCRVFLVCKQTGVAIEEGMPLTSDPAGPWGPYKLWHADLAECPLCGYQVATGFGILPLSEHYRPNYAAMKEAMPPLVRIDACSGYKP